MNFIGYFQNTWVFPKEVNEYGMKNWKQVAKKGMMHNSPLFVQMHLERT